MELSQTLYCILILSTILCTTKSRSILELKDKLEKPNKSSEEQAEYDKEVLLGGKERSIEDMSEEEQKEKLKIFIEKKMDVNKNKFIEREELLEWTKDAMKELQNRELEEEFKVIDADGNGKILWSEFSSSIFGEQKNSSLNKEEKIELENAIKEEKKIFAVSDQDGDGSLNLEELKAFRFPLTNNATRKAWIVKTLDKTDSNKDGSVSFDEYIEFLKKHDNDEELDDDNDDWINYERHKFSETLDADKDGVLKGDEILKWNGPQDIHQNAETETDHLIEECDSDHDQKLTVDEILNNHDLWLNTEATEFGRKLMDEL